MYLPSDAPGMAELVWAEEDGLLAAGSSGIRKVLCIRAGVSKVRPAGRIRTVQVSNPTRGALPENSKIGQKST